MAKGGQKKFLRTRGVNKVSGTKRGDSDITLQEGGKGPLPPHAHVRGRASFLSSR